MLNNLSFNRVKSDSKVFRKPFPNYQFIKQSDGSVRRVEVVDPYEGLSSDSFSLSAQLAAGVPLTGCSPMSGGSLHSVDVNNERATKFIQSINDNQ